MTTEEVIADFCVRQWGDKDRPWVGLKLAEESGEVCGALVKIPEGRATEEDLDKEIGDVLIVLSQLAAQKGLTLESLRECRFKQIVARAQP